MVIQEHYSVAKPDESLRHCKGRPAKPALKDDVDESNLIIDLDDRGEDCSSKLDKTWQSIDDAAAYAEELNRAQAH